MFEVMAALVIFLFICLLIEVLVWYETNFINEDE